MSLGDRSSLLEGVVVFSQTQLAWFDLNISMWGQSVSLNFTIVMDIYEAATELNKKIEK